MSANSLLKTKPKCVLFDGEWREAIGNPELSGTWMIYGPPKNGKTSFAMMLAKYLSKFSRVGYNSIEEGYSMSIREAVRRADMQEAGKRVFFFQKDAEGMIDFLKNRKNMGIVIVDSLQFMGVTFDEYKRIKESFKNKLFIYISHVDGRNPDGNSAKRIMRDASVIFRVEGFKASPTSRYGGGEPIVIDEWQSNENWATYN